MPAGRSTGCVRPFAARAGRQAGRAGQGSSRLASRLCRPLFRSTILSDPSPTDGLTGDSHTATAGQDTTDGPVASVSSLGRCLAQPAARPKVQVRGHPPGRARPPQTPWQARAALIPTPGKVPTALQAARRCRAGAGGEHGVDGADASRARPTEWRIGAAAWSAQLPAPEKWHDLHYVLAGPMDL